VSSFLGIRVSRKWLAVIVSASSVLAVGKVANFSARTLLARILPVSDFGIFNAAIALVSLVGTFSTLGMQQGLVRYYPMAENSGKSSVVQLVGMSLYRAIIAVIISVLFLSIIQFFFQYPIINNIDLSFWYVTMLMVLGFTFVNLLSYLMMARGYPRAYLASLHCAPALLFLLGILILQWLDGVNLFSSISLYSGVFLFVVACLLFYNKECWYGVVSREAKVDKSGFTRYSNIILGSTVAYVALTSVDRLMLGWFSNFDEVAYYSVAFTLAALLPLAMIVVDAFLSPKISRGFANNDMELVTAAYHKANGGLFWIAVSMTFFILIFSEPLLSLFGDNYRSAASLLAVLVIGELFTLMMGTTGRMLQLGGLERREALVVWLMLGINVGANVMLIPLYGAMGAAISTATTRVIHGSVKGFLVYRGFKIFPWGKGIMVYVKLLVLFIAIIELVMLVLR